MYTKIIPHIITAVWLAHLIVCWLRWKRSLVQGKEDKEKEILCAGLQSERLLAQLRQRTLQGKTMNEMLSGTDGKCAELQWEWSLAQITETTTQSLSKKLSS